MSNELVKLIHVALKANTSVKRMNEIQEELMRKYPEVRASAYHGTKDYNPDYPTQV